MMMMMTMKKAKRKKVRNERKNPSQKESTKDSTARWERNEEGRERKNSIGDIRQRPISHTLSPSLPFLLTHIALLDFASESSFSCSFARVKP